MTRTALGTILVAVLLVHCAPPGASAAGAGHGKIHPDLLEALEADAVAPFFVVMKARADLAVAGGIADRETQGRVVQQTLSSVARSSQAGVVGLLAARGVPHTTFYVVNAVRVVADLATALDLAARPDVERVVPERVHALPQPEPGEERDRVGSVEWNVARIGADRVWREFGATGQGIVVGNIDTGVDYLHPALARSYRGNLGGGSFDHDYSWFDPSGICGGAGSAPCDNNAHGTHTMGTMVGGDGDGALPDDVGVAPGARWIAAKGCEFDSCTEGSLLAAAQFMLAPTDTAGKHPDPSRRPHVVNNSWGGPGGDTLFRGVIDAWRAAGIFPVFSAGNDGVFGCRTAGSPGDDPFAFAVGATDIADAIAYFSSRGAAPVTGIVKPDATAPGVSVRSAIPGAGFAAFDGTSMAAPHVAGVVALLWSGNPALRRDVAATFDALRSTAQDIVDLTCGGEPGGDPNNVYGDGRVDAYAACLRHCGPRAELTGRVRAASLGGPIGGAAVLARRVGDGAEIAATSAADGSYAIALPVRPGSAAETYSVGFTAFGYEPRTFAATAVPDGSLRRNIRLTSLPRYTVSGFVLSADDLSPVANATVRLVGTPLAEQQTGADGAYLFAGVPRGRYGVRASRGVCHEPRRRQVNVKTTDVRRDVRLRPVSDAFGHACEEPVFGWIPGAQVVPYDYPARRVALPFPFYFYGERVRAIHASETGHLTFTPVFPHYYNSPLPSPLTPNGALYPFWSNISTSAVRVATIGERPDRVLAIEYDSFSGFPDFGPFAFEVLLHERDSAITFQYRTAQGGVDGSAATIGIENASGTDAVQIGFLEPVVHDGLAVRFVPPTIDSDEDGVPEQIDLCPGTPDPEQRDRDGDGLGNACDDFDGALRPTRLQVFRSTSDSSPNGRIVLKGEMLVLGAGDSLDVSDGLTIAVKDALQLDAVAEWVEGECKTTRRGTVRCRRSAVPRDVAELKPLPSDIPGFRTYLFSARLVRRDLDAPFVAPLRLTMVNAPRTPGLGIDRVGTPLDCQARSYGLECLTGREGSASRAFLVEQASSLID